MPFQVYVGLAVWLIVGFIVVGYKNSFSWASETFAINTAKNLDPNTCKVI